jgi:hypothetical protein
MNVFVTGIDMSDGKSVLLLAPESMDEQDIFELKRVLDNRFPGSKFVVLSGGFQAIATTSNDMYYEIEDI